MKILINAVSARAGGGVSYLVRLLQVLPVVCPDDQFLAAIPDVPLPIDVRAPRNLEIRVFQEASGTAFRRFVWENTGLISLCHQWKADRLFCVANIAPLVDPGIPVTVVVGNVAPLTPKVIRMICKFEGVVESLQMYFLQKLTLRALKKADSIIALSHSTASIAKRWYPDVKPEVLYHGISEEFHPDASRPALAGEEPYSLYVSNLYVYKGLEFLIEAMAIDRSLPRVFVAGKPFHGKYYSEMRRLAAARGVENRVVFLDSIHYKELPGWYASAVSMVYPSWCENCPNILLEAMACGCPVVAFDTGPMPEICGNAAIYAKPLDSASLAVAMRRVLDVGRSKLRAASIERAAHFTWEKAMREHARILTGRSSIPEICQRC